MGQLQRSGGAQHEPGPGSLLRNVVPGSDEQDRLLDEWQSIDSRVVVHGQSDPVCCRSVVELMRRNVRMRRGRLVGGAEWRYENQASHELRAAEGKLRGN